MDISTNLQRALGSLDAVRADLDAARAAVQAALDGLAPVEPWIDRIADMPINRKPDHPDMVAKGWTFWPDREPSQITGITIHHTMSHSPLAMAQYITRPVAQRGKGYPSTQYALWVSADDDCPVYLLAPLTWAIWSDHTGSFQTTISIGMAGDLSVVTPSAEQIAATAHLCAYLMETYNIPLAEVQGHNERAWKAVKVKTDCPGWVKKNWRAAFFAALDIAMEAQ